MLSRVRIPLNSGSHGRFSNDCIEKRNRVSTYLIPLQKVLLEFTAITTTSTGTESLRVTDQCVCYCVPATTAHTSQRRKVFKYTQFVMPPLSPPRCDRTTAAELLRAHTHTSSVSAQTNRVEQQHCTRKASSVNRVPSVSGGDHSLQPS